VSVVKKVELGTINTFLFLVGFIFVFGQMSYTAFFGEVKTGLQNVASDQYGYSFYVPPDYTPDRGWPLVVVLHDEGDLGEEYIQGWLGAAKERGFLIFCPNYPVPRDFPYDSEAWLLKHKRTFQSQYHIDPNRILVTGSGFGGHYALYLGLRYPEEFAAVASVGNAMSGRFQRLFAFSFAKVNRLPVLILKGSEDNADDSEKATAELKTMRSRGYVVETVEAKTREELSVANASPHIFEWFEQVSLERESGARSRSWSPRQKFFEWADNLLRNR